MIFNISNSSAVEKVEVIDDQVLVTFNGGRQYTYNSTNLEQFISTLSETITKGESVGRFINRSLADNLTQVV